jgi:hypothetical protein
MGSQESMARAAKVLMCVQMSCSRCCGAITRLQRSLESLAGTADGAARAEKNLLVFAWVRCFSHTGGWHVQVWLKQVAGIGAVLPHEIILCRQRAWFTTTAGICGW